MKVSPYKVVHDRIYGPARVAARAAIVRKAAHYCGLTPIGKIVPQDIIVAGYPKSGNTWFQNIVVGLAYGIDTHRLPDSLVQDLAPDFQARSFYRRYQTPTYFKSHHLPRPEYRRIVYLVRDGRDAMVSYLHHRRALEGDHVSFADMIDRAEGLYPGHWHEHVRAYLANPYGASMMVIRYEDMHTDAMGELRRFCDFVGCPRTDADLERVVADTSFARMRAKEQTMGWHDGIWPAQHAFIRRGKVGSHKDEMPPELMERFTKMARPELERLGYLQAPAVMR